MKKKYLIPVAIVILLGGGLWFSSRAGLLKNMSKEDGPKQPTAQQSAPHGGHEAKETPQTQPPAPQEQAKEEAPLEEPPTIEVPPEKQQLIGVKTVQVSVMPLRKIIRTVGRVEYDERKIATVNTKFEGWIERLHVDYTGKYVKKGEPLAEIYSPELFATQREYLNSLKWSREEKSEYWDRTIGLMLSKDSEAIREAGRQRLKLWDISDEQIKKIEESGKPIRTMTIYSPVSGYVVQKMAVQGMRVMPGEKLFDIVDLSTVWINSDIYEYELPLIKEGQPATISLSYFPGREFSSRIDYVYPTLAGETRTAKARFTIQNPGGKLKPQMFTNVEIKIELGKRPAIPDDAVIDTGVRQIVYVDKGEGLFEPREVMLGIRAEGFREVLKGLKVGERVASAAAFLLDSEAQLKGVTPLGGHKH